MPFAFWNDTSAAGPQLTVLVRCGLSDDSHPSRDDVDQFIPIRMQFAAVWRVAVHVGDSDHEPVTDGRRPRAGVHRRHAQVARNSDWAVSEIALSTFPNSPSPAPRS